RERGDDAARRPAVVVRLDQRVAQGEKAERGAEEPGYVWTLLVRGVARLVDERERREDAEHADRNVDVEDPVPVDALGDQAADEGADREGERRHARPDADRRAALARREGDGDGREGRRGHQ